MKLGYTHVFLIHTKFQELVCEKIMSQLSSENKSSAFVAVYEGLLPRSSHLWDDFLESESCNGSVVNLRRKNIQKIIGFIAKQPGLKRYYFSDLAWPTNNVIYNSLKDVGGHKCSLFMDGAFVYFDPQVSVSQYLKGIFKWGVAKLVSGYSYKPYMGRLMGWQQDFVDEVWGAELDKAEIDSRKIRTIDFLKSDSTPISERHGTLFLDQPYHEKYFSSSGSSLSKLVTKLIKENFEPPYYYKRHHFQDQDVTEYFSKNGFVIVESSESIENLDIISKVESVVSFNSTALITSKIMYRDDLHCYHLMDQVGHYLIPKKSRYKITTVFGRFRIDAL